jgi:hypothetical protein
MSLKDFKSYEPISLPITKKTGTTIALYGASKQGKSNVLVWLWKKYFGDAITVLCTPNSQQPVYHPFINKAIITPNFETFEELVKIAYEIQLGTDNHYRWVFIMDDVVDHKNSKTLKKLILTLRNSNMSTIISVQGDTIVERNERSSINIGIFFRFNNFEGARGVVEKYLMGYYNTPSILGATRQYQKELDKHEYIIGNLIDQIFTKSKLPIKLLTN